MKIESAWRLLERGRTVEALKIVEHILSQASSAENKEKIAQALHLKARILAHQGLYEEVCSVIDTWERIVSSSSLESEFSDRVDMLLLKAESLWKSRDYDRALECLESAEQACTSLPDGDEKTGYRARITFRRATIMYHLHRLDEALEGLLESKRMFEEIGDEVRVGRVLNNLGLVYEKQGEVQKAIKHYRESIRVKEAISDKEDVALSLYNLGRLYRSRGDFKHALESLERSLAIREEIGNERAIAATLNEIGSIYLLRGELDSAEGAYLRTGKIWEKLSDQRALSGVYVNLGIINYARGRLERARSFYVKALEYAKQSNDLTYQAYVYHNLIELEIMQGNTAVAKEYLDRFEQLCETPSKSLNDILKLTKAVYLKQSTRVAEKAEAQKLLAEIINDNATDVSLEVNAILHVCELLFEEYEAFNDSQALTDLKKRIEKLEGIARSQESSLLLVQTLLLKAKLAIIEENVMESNALLSQAKALCEEKGLLNLEIQVSALFDELSYLKHPEETELKRNTRKEAIHFKKLLDAAASPMHQPSVQIHPENPIAFVVMNAQGGMAFYQQFVDDRFFNEQMLFGIIPFITMVVMELHKNKGTVERITISDYTLLLKELGGLFLVYIIQGPSYSAVEKLEALARSLRSRVSLWEWLQDKSRHSSGEGHKKLQKLVSEVIEVETTVESEEEKREEEEETEDFPAELLEFRKLLHPIKIAILNILSKHYRITLSNLRRILGISWGNLDTHLSKLKALSLVDQKTEFVGEIAKEVLYFTPQGIEQYNKLKGVLHKLL